MASSTYQNIVRNIRKRAKAEGYAEGYAEAKAEIAQAKSEQFVTNFIQLTDFDDVRIAGLVEVTLEFVKSIRQKLAKKP